MKWLSSSCTSNLHSLACDEITQSHAAALKEIASKNVNIGQWEAKFVAHLCRAMGEIAKAWQKELIAAQAGVQINMATVFTHQSPYVKWKDGATTKKCELADVMLAIIDRTAGVQKGFAVLVQAKLSTTRSVSLTNFSEQKQFDLFSARPVFDFFNTGAPKGIDLSNLTPDSALMYALTSSTKAPLPSSFPYPHFWLTAQDLRSSIGSYKVSVDDADCLAFKLVSMLFGNTGWEFAVPPKGSDWRNMAAASPRDDWSTLINYLLAQTFAKPVSIAQRAAIGRISRGQEDVVHLASTNSAGQRMFFIGHGMADSTAAQYFSGDFENDTDDWRIVSPDDGPAFDGGGGSGEGGEQVVADEPPEGGPLSAILFEVGG